MSGATSPRDFLFADRIAPGSITAAVLDAIAAPVRRTAFWAAVALPLSYLPLLVGGLDAAEAKLFAALVAINALAFVVGHGYGS